jgi:hypothetical protein
MRRPPVAAAPEIAVTVHGLSTLRRARMKMSHGSRKPTGRPDDRQGELS